MRPLFDLRSLFAGDSGKDHEKALIPLRKAVLVQPAFGIETFVRSTMSVFFTSVRILA